MVGIRGVVLSTGYSWVGWIRAKVAHVVQLAALPCRAVPSLLEAFTDVPHETDVIEKQQPDT